MKHALDETTQNRVDRLWEYSKNLEEVPLCRSVGHKSECLCYVEERTPPREIRLPSLARGAENGSNGLLD